MDHDLTFKTAVIHAIKSTIRQGRQSVDTNGGECMLRGADGDCCTIGFMIKDTIYTKNLEDLTPKDGTLIRAIILSLGIDSLSDDQKVLLTTLQSAHDFPGSLIDFVESYTDTIKYLVESGELPDWILGAMY